MVVHRVLDSDKRFLPLDILAVDETMCLLFQAKIRHVWLLKVEDLQEQKQQLVVVLVAEKDVWDSATVVTLKLQQ